jgi:hypothetical protein
MSKSFLLLLSLCCCTGLSAQSSLQRCWDFEESCNNYEESFRTGCIPNAISTHGSPDTKSDYNLPAPSGARYATAKIQYELCPTPGSDEWQATRRGDGFALEFNFTAGVPYVITLKARSRYLTSANDNWDSKCDLFLSNNLTNSGGLENPAAGTCQMQFSTLPPTQPPAISVIGESLDWVTYSFPVTPNSNFNQLWFRPDIIVNNNANTGLVGNFFHIDNICISRQQTEPPCAPPGFSVNLCQIQGTKLVRATISGLAAPPALPQAAFALYPIGNCAAGFVIGNTGAPIPIAWAGAASFNLPANSGCYALVYLSTTSGCPPTFVSEIINTNGVNTSCPLGSVEREAAFPLKVSNPVDQFISLNIIADEGTAQLFSLYGALIKTYPLAQNSQLNVSDVPEGQYVLLVQTPQGRSTHKILIIRR